MQDAVTWGIIWAVVLISLFWFVLGIFFGGVAIISDSVSRWKKDEWQCVAFVSTPVLIWLVWKLII